MQKSILSEHQKNGALHFLEAKAYADLLLYEYEKSALQPFEPAASLEHLEKAIAGLEAARIRFTEAIDLGKKIGYNPDKVKLFRQFNQYDRFIERHRLNRHIAGEVKEYLQDADILGAYQHCLDDMEELLNTLFAMQVELKAGRAPGIREYWQLLQQFAEAALFGNYASVMGTHILGLYQP